MAIVTNTFTSYSDNRKRETLSDLISLIDPDETPFYSMVGTEKVDGKHPEWNLDSLATPSTSNARVEGDVYSYSALTATTRVGNYTQNSFKEFIVSETEEVISKAGPKSEFNRQKAKKGVELRTDMEVTLLSNQASVAGASGTAPLLGGLRAWLATNDDLGGSGASGGFSAGLVTAATNGTQRSFTKTLLDNNIQTIYQAGGNPTTIMGSPYLKRVFSTFMADANVALNRRTLSGNGQATITAAADEYVSDFGVLSFVPNRQMARVGATLARNLYILTPDKIKVGVLRPIQEDADVAKTSDAKPGVLKVEYTLLVKNEAASGVIADLFGMTAST